MVNCLLLVTGSVAAIKTWKLRDEILKALPAGSEVRVVATDSGLHFLNSAACEKPAEGSAASHADPPGERTTLTLLSDKDEWSAWQGRGDPVVHIELRKWADVGVVAPLCANTLAKMATGIADNLVTSVLRAWDFRARKPIVIAPAMNTAMWEHPLTAPQIATVLSFGSVVLVPPVAKTLVCGDTGVGAMADLAVIAAAVAVATAAKADDDE